MKQRKKVKNNKELNKTRYKQLNKGRLIERNKKQ